ncbi:hypothetical protein JTE90_026266 [Oedothorax gibbosus]|uniref:Uncharacterized protein n=1 Tax=Oedothorax gibbosus TaxID=931172 RepID=A0AAV6U471_9ARAC|nr:hypothetical protein JTE90_026266 [Oedothorax gibbosus]
MTKLFVVHICIGCHLAQPKYFLPAWKPTHWWLFRKNKLDPDCKQTERDILDTHLTYLLGGVLFKDI